MKSSASSRIGVAGHRGWPARFPDNCQEGIAAAFEVVDLVEIDIRRTVDGALVLSHDPESCGAVVSEITLGAFRDLPLGATPTTIEDLIRIAGPKAVNTLW